MFRLKTAISLLVMLSLTLLTSCGSKVGTKRETPKSSREPNGEIWAAGNGNSSANPASSRAAAASTASSAIRPGMTYEAVVAQLGPAQEWEGTYVWTALSGQYRVTFNAKNEATSYNFQSADSSSAGNPEIAKLIYNHASFNSVSAHLGGTPVFAGGTGEWQPPGAQMMSRISFTSAGVSSYREFPAFHEPTSRNPNPH